MVLLAATAAGSVIASPGDPGAPTRLAAAVAEANDAGETLQLWALRGQFTAVTQYDSAFTSPYRGPSSLNPSAETMTTSDLKLHAGARLWEGAEAWVTPEIDQGFGLSNTVGVAGFPSVKAYKVGASRPYGGVHRAFVRQTLSLEGDSAKADAGLNQFASLQTANRVIVTAAEFSVVNFFDNNSCADDPRNDFLNWSITDVGAFDYAANAWGYSTGAAGEWYQDS